MPKLQSTTCGYIACLSNPMCCFYLILLHYLTDLPVRHDQALCDHCRKCCWFGERFATDGHSDVVPHQFVSCALVHALPFPDKELSLGVRNPVIWINWKNWIIFVSKPACTSATHPHCRQRQGGTSRGQSSRPLPLLGGHMYWQASTTRVLVSNMWCSLRLLPQCSCNNIHS